MSTFNIPKQTNYTDINNVVQNLATDMAKIGTGGGGGGSTVTTSATNGHITVNGSDMTVYNDTSIQSSVSSNTTNIASNTTNIGSLVSLQTVSKTNLVSAINEVKSGISTFSSVTSDPVSPAVGQVWFRSDL